MADSPQTLRWAQYEAITVTVTMSPATDITGWALKFSVRDNSRTLMFTAKTVGSGITITDAGSGVFTVTILTADTGAMTPGGVYSYDVWRTDSTHEARLAYGPVQVDRQQRV
jgi:hypothetical protein